MSVHLHHSMDVSFIMSSATGNMMTIPYSLVELTMSRIDPAVGGRLLSKEDDVGVERMDKPSGPSYTEYENSICQVPKNGSQSRVLIPAF